MGHSVIIVTSQKENFEWNGVREFCGFKVFYLSLPELYRCTTWPTFYGSLIELMRIFTMEGIDIVHAHQAFSPLGHEAILHARSMGLPTVFTDHSLFRFEDFSSITTNQWLRMTLGDVGRVICVSHCSKENTVLRASLDPSHVFVIPNAVDAVAFKPQAENLSSILTVVVLSRLVYRKGVDLLVALIPIICAKNPQVHFLIGGDGPKRIDLEQMRERHQLHARVRLVGAVPTQEVPSFLRQGHIFLNCSLTEAFCMAILEAACCGLRVVSTGVGGVPEVLPPHMIRLARAEVGDLIHQLSRCIQEYAPPVNASEHHQQLTAVYDWQDVARRTLAVYYEVIEGECGESSLDVRLRKALSAGPYGGIAWALLVALDCFLVFYLRVLFSYRKPHGSKPKK